MQVQWGGDSCVTTKKGGSCSCNYREKGWAKHKRMSGGEFQNSQEAMKCLRNINTEDSKVKKHLKLPVWETREIGPCKGQK